MAKFLDYYADLQSLCGKRRRDRVADSSGWIRHQDIFSAAWQMVGESQEGGPPIERPPPCVIGEDAFAGAELLFLCDVHATCLVPRRRGPEGFWARYQASARVRSRAPSVESHRP